MARCDSCPHVKKKTNTLSRICFHALHALNTSLFLYDARLFVWKERLFRLWQQCYQRIKPGISRTQDEKSEGSLPFSRVGVALRCAGIQVTDQDLKWNHKSHTKHQLDRRYSYQDILELATKFKASAVPLRTLRKSFQEVRQSQIMAEFVTFLLASIFLQHYFEATPCIGVCITRCPKTCRFSILRTLDTPNHRYIIVKFPTLGLV